MRVFDIVLTIVGIAVMSLLSIIALILKFSGEGKTGYKYVGIGRGEDRFIYIYKLPTMVKNRLIMGAGALTEHGDPQAG